MTILREARFLYCPDASVPVIAEDDIESGGGRVHLPLLLKLHYGSARIEHVNHSELTPRIMAYTYSQNTTAFLSRAVKDKTLCGPSAPSTPA